MVIIIKPALLAALIVSTASARTITVTNKCSFTIWPAMFTDPSGPIPNYPTGWTAASQSSVNFAVPDNWKSGRIWGRRNCDFSTNPGPNSCLDGGCNGGLQCDKTTGGGVPPATLAEFTLSGAGGKDYYDVSVVDGFNLPMKITPSVSSCHPASCSVDLVPNCPVGLRGPFDRTGKPVGCKSDCLVAPNPGNSPACCSGQYNTPAKCPSSGVPHYRYFKSNCPDSYAYAYDESSKTAIWTCSHTDYTITFCP